MTGKKRIGKLKMADHEFKPGETVQMKSGGPDMTYIGDAGLPGMVACEWFDGGQKKPMISTTLV